MPSSFFGLDIASSGMSTYNAWLNTTAHNIANVKTTGYSKQTVNQQAKEAISLGTSWGMIGSGVDAISIESQRDIYYDNKYRLSNTQYGKYDTLNYYMDSIENYLWAKTSDSGAITNSMDLFFESLSSLTEHVSDPTKRTQTVGYANALVGYIQEAATSLKETQKDINSRIADTVDKINAYASEIASLTRQINTLEVYGASANDLRDQRATIVDNLSQLVGVEVVEKPAAEGKGINQFIVTIGSAVLVDTYDYNTIFYETRDTYNAMNDVTDLYDLRWSTGQDFGIHDTDLGGELQALFQLRDGNNGEVFEGKATGAEGDTVLKVTDVNELGNSIFKLQIPSEKGILTVDHIEYEYEYFECEIDENGEYNYTFYLTKPLGKDFDGADMNVSDAVDFRGIPYYMAQLDEFVRTFSNAFNEVQTSGYDSYGELGNQLFIGLDTATGIQMNFDGTKEIENAQANGGYKFSSKGTGTVDARGYMESSYYRLTALNTCIDSEILKDGKLLACSGQENGGISNGENLAKLSALGSDVTMFRQGQPGSFLQVMISSLGVDGEKIKANAENAENIKNAVDERRMSKSGVDEDEEGQNLIICQNLLNYQYKVLSVMNEVLDKLINETAI